MQPMLAVLLLAASALACDQYFGSDSNDKSLLITILDPDVPNGYPNASNKYIHLCGPTNTCAGPSPPMGCHRYIKWYYDSSCTELNDSKYANVGRYADKGNLFDRDTGKFVACDAAAYRKEVYCYENGPVECTGPPDCTLDECDSNPCGMDQTCNDPDTRQYMQGDFVCTCDSNPTISAVAMPAACNTSSTPGNTTMPPAPPTPGNTTMPPAPPTPGNTTMPPAPPTPGNTTMPPTPGNTTMAPTPGNTTMPPAPGNTTMSPAPGNSTLPPYTPPPRVEDDECKSNPCPAGQTCSDLDPYGKGNFMCTCPSSNATKVGGAANCTAEVNECLPVNPCGKTQNCHDKSGDKGDFVCTCRLRHAGEGKPSTGSPASCAPVKGGLSWKVLVLKFYGMWRGDVVSNPKWAAKLKFTLLSLFVGTDTPSLTISYVCPLDKERRKPKPGSTLASQCWSPFQAKGAHRGLDTLASSQAELEEALEQKAGIFAEVIVEDANQGELDTAVSLLQTSLQEASQGKGKLVNPSVWTEGGIVEGEPVEGGLVISPIPFRDGSLNKETTDLYKGRGGDALSSWSPSAAAGYDEDPEVTEAPKSDDDGLAAWVIALIVSLGLVCVVGVVAAAMFAKKSSSELSFNEFSRILDNDTALPESYDSEIPMKKMD